MRKNTFIISYPKCGRTWLRAIMGEYLVTRYKIDTNDSLDVFSITRNLPLSTTTFTHNNSSLNDRGQISNDKSEFYGSTTILLTRDIKDTIVSYYFHVTKRENVSFCGSLSDFIHSEYGIDPIIRFYQSWKNQNVDLHITYEQMKEDTFKHVTSVLHTIGETSIDKKILERAINKCSFDSLQSLEKEGKFNSKRLRVKDPTDQNSCKVRRGIVGGYKDYMKDDDINFINNQIRSKL